MSTTIKSIKRRISSAKNLKQITKAMEMVSASKMRRAQEKTLSTRPYSQKLKEILSQLSDQPTENHPMLRKPDTSNPLICIILVSSDRGLCGALNTNLFRALEEFKESLGQERPEQPLSFEYVAVGRKAREYVLKSGQTLHAEFTHLSEKPKFEDILPISRIAMEGFITGRYREIFIVYTDFISTLNQEVSSIKLMPVEARKIKADVKENVALVEREYIFEPDASAVLDELLPHYIEMQVYQTTLEAIASEQSARMVSMRNASENASEIITDLTLTYNNRRQQSITNEISDLITSRMAVNS